MKFTVNEIDILDSRAGEGLRVGDKTIGCARVTGITLEDGKTLYDYAKEGLVLETISHLELVYGDGEEEVLALNDKDIKNSNNYVLFVREPDNADGSKGDVSVILGCKDITDLFKLPESDAENLQKYLGLLAEQRGLVMINYTDLETNTESIMFVNQFDREIVDALLDNDQADAKNSYKSMLSSNEFRSELQTHNFIRTFLLSIVKTGQDRYNKLNRDDVITEVAKKLVGITYWVDGELVTPTVKNINDYLVDITENIRIK